MKQQSGFTLIELSIVLVIIGLIVGGVLVGRDLIHAAEIRKTISEIEKLNVAAMAFRAKYDCLPGDCKTATNFFAAVTQPAEVSNGNGDGTIDAGGGDKSGVFNNTERPGFFDHLAAAGMIALAQFDENASASIAAGVGYPAVPVGKGVVVSNSAGGQVACADFFGCLPVDGHYFLLGINNQTEGEPYFDTDPHLVPAPDAYAIDSKMDDGKPLTGSVMALVADSGDAGDIVNLLSIPAETNACVSNASGYPYAANDAASYNCTLAIKSAF